MTKVRRFTVVLIALVVAMACTVTPQPAAANRWSIASNGAPVRAGEDVRIVLTYRPWGSRPVPNRVDFYAVCLNCPGVAGAPVDSAINGFFLLTPEQCSEASRNGPGPDSAICWSVPISFPYAGRWRFTSPLDIDLDVGAAASPAPAATAASEASTCGRLVSYAFDGTRRLVTLEIRSIDQSVRTFELQLVGPGTVPADVAEQFAARTAQTLFVRGRFERDPSRPLASTVANYVVTRITEPCPTTR